jgi:hypothetical protein
MISVAVVGNIQKPFTHASTLFEGLPLGAVVSGFFIALITVTAPLAILSTHDCRGEGGKRFSLTQGERLPERATARDKQTHRLMDWCRDRFSGLINKAVAVIKGQTPMTTPTEVKVG